MWQLESLRELFESVHTLEKGAEAIGEAMTNASAQYDINTIKQEINGIRKALDMYNKHAMESADEILDWLGPVYKRLVLTAEQAATRRDAGEPQQSQGGDSRP